jgi:hippurate hydrolase
MTVERDAQLREWRHHFHRHPEVGFGEHDTSDYIAATLSGLGIDVARGVGGTGVVGTLRRGESGRAIGLRADMDALTLHEIDGRDHRSTRDGVMHACGHDGHMAMLLGAAAALATDGTFDGTVRFVFQPAEEHGRGAVAMLDAGLLERFPMEAMYGLHNMPGIPTGQLHTRAGAIMASEDNFTITVRGRGGHASRPQAVIDPLLVAAEIVVALQSIVSRSVDPIDTAVVSCTEIHGDGARNAIPSTVVISGDTRSFSPVVQQLLGRRIREIADGICAAHGATCEVTYTNSFRPTVNDPACTAAAVDAAAATVGAERVDGACPPVMASEDFAAFAARIPACYLFVGNGMVVGSGGTPLHSRDYDFNDDVLRVGVGFYVNLAHQVLAGEAR